MFAGDRVVVKWPATLPKKGKVMAMQMHWVSRRNECAGAVGRNMAGCGYNHPDPIISWMIVVRDDIKMGFFDQFIELIEVENRRLAEIDAEGCVMHIPSFLGDQVSLTFEYEA